MRQEVGANRQAAAGSLRQVLDERRLAIVFQPIHEFRAERVVGFEALVRGPEGSFLETPFELFGEAQREDALIELNIVCIQEILRAFARRNVPGLLFMNISPQLIVQRGFDQARAARFLASLGLESERVVIELTEDYPAFDFGLVRESLMLYRSMGFRVAIDDLGEGFSSLRLWSELKPEFVKADKHFVTGIADDAVKVHFLRAIQNIAESSGAQVVAEGIESADDFRVVRSLGIAFGQGYFIGRPQAAPSGGPAAPAIATSRPHFPSFDVPHRDSGTLRAHDFVLPVDAASPSTPLAQILERFAASSTLAAIPVLGSDGFDGVVSRLTAETLGGGHPRAAEPCAGYVDAAPIRADADLDLSELTAILADADPRRLADGFVVVSRGKYLGMGRSQDVMRALRAACLRHAR
jgi:EAL domain-containing protein (putative c-di-GMP-specific phosphodiesterase class I)